MRKLLMHMHCVVLAGLFCLAWAQPSWEFSRARHGLSTLSAASTRRLCGQTDMGRLNADLDRLLVKRVAGTAGAKAVWAFLRNRTLSLGFSVETDEFSDSTPFGNRTFRNLIATWNPEAPRRLVLACHYDSKFFTKFEFLAATDSAFPCALMLEVAEGLRPLLWTGTEEDVSLQLLFFDGEEAFKDWTATDSIYGARHLAQHWEAQAYASAGATRNTLQRIDVMVLLDLLGVRGSQIRNFDMGAAKYFDGLVQIETELAKAGCLKLGKTKKLKPETRIFLPARYSGSHVEDDHIPFHQRSVPILHAIPVPFPAVWHNRGDNRAALDADTMGNLVSIFRVFVARYLHIPDQALEEERM